MNNQILIQQMIQLNININTTKNKLEKLAYQAYQEEIIENYYQKCNEECHHEKFLHNAYFLETELKECEREKAGFRFITCKTCGKQILLIKTDDFNWDEKVGNRSILVSSKMKNYKL